MIIPESVTAIGDFAFKYCNIKKLDHPCLSINNGVAVKDGKLLYCASRASEIAIPEAVTVIGENAFFACNSLTSVEFAGTKEEWNKIEKDVNWNKRIAIKSVKCSDGEEEI